MVTIERSSGHEAYHLRESEYVPVGVSQQIAQLISAAFADPQRSIGLSLLGIAGSAPSSVRHYRHKFAPTVPFVQSPHLASRSR